MTPTWIVRAAVKLQESVELPEAVTLLGDRVQEAVLLVARLTMPENSLSVVMVIVEFADCPTRIVDGLVAVSVKSGADSLGTATRVCVEWLSVPLVPVMVNV